MHNNWDDWQYIISVISHGTLSGAARSLGVNHATVLRHIASFESRRGIRLFERHKNRYTPTTDCLVILGRLKHLQHSVHALETAVTNAGNPFYGRVGLTSTDTICQLILPRYIKRLNGLHPDLEIELASTNSKLDLSLLDAEITIRPTASLPPELVGQRACNISMQIFGSTSYLAENKSHCMEDHSWLGFSDNQGTTPIGEWELATKLPNVVFRSDSFLTICSAAEVGMGLALMPNFVGINSPHLARAEQFADVVTNEIHVAAHRDRINSARIQMLIEYFRDALMGDKELIEGII